MSNSTRRRRRTWPVLLLAGSAPALLLGPPSIEAQPPSPPPSFQEVLDVNLVNVDVVVVDKKGELVTDLGRDDFQITDDGKKVEVEYFARLTGGMVDAAATTAAPRRLRRRPPRPSGSRDRRRARSAASDRLRRRRQRATAQPQSPARRDLGVPGVARRGRPPRWWSPTAAPGSTSSCRSRPRRSSGRRRSTRSRRCRAAVMAARDRAAAPGREHQADPAPRRLGSGRSRALAISSTS